MFYNIKHCTITLFLIVVNNQFNSVLSQGTDTYNDTIIKWISQFPSAKEDKNKLSLAKKITEFVTGRNEQAGLIKPVSVLAINPDTFFVFDYENGQPFYVVNQQLNLIKCLKKNNLSFPSLTNASFKNNNEIIFTDSRLNKILCFFDKQREVKSLYDSIVFEQPTGIAYSLVKNEIWVVETAAHRISVLNSKGDIVRYVGKRGTGHGEFNYPTSIWIDNIGYVYVIDAMNYRIQIFNKEGEFVSCFGKQGDASGYFARPKGIASDSNNNIYITDALFHNVQIFDKEGKLLYIFGEQGREPGQFWMPAGIYIDKNDFIYVSDTYNSRIQIFKVYLNNIK